MSPHLRAPLALLACALPPLGCVSAAGESDRFVSMPSAVVQLGPANEVEQMALGAFSIAVTMVTNREYAAFLNSDYAAECECVLWAGQGHFQQDIDPLMFKDGCFVPRVGAEGCPASRVTHAGANAYCRWLSGRNLFYDFRLPSEWEWEYAARGVRGQSWPWGSEDPDATRGLRWESIQWDQGRQWMLRPVGSYPANRTPEGVLDMMAYPMWEWCVEVASDRREGGGLRPARGGPVVTASGVTLLDALLSDTQRPGRVWSRWLIDDGAGNVLVGFRVVRVPK